MEVIVGGVLGTVRRTELVIAGRYSDAGELVMVGRTVPLSAAQSGRGASMLYWLRWRLMRAEDSGEPRSWC